jgi:hypothetical protein
MNDLLRVKNLRVIVLLIIGCILLAACQSYTTSSQVNQANAVDVQQESVTLQKESPPLSQDKQMNSNHIQTDTEKSDIAQSDNTQSDNTQSIQTHNTSPTSQAKPAIRQNNASTPSLVIHSTPSSTVTLSVKGDAERGVIINPTSIEIHESMSVLEVLLACAKQKGISLNYSGTGMMAYVIGIEGLNERDRGDLSGWVYRVNGVMAQKSAGSFIVKDGDKIEWLYSLNLGRDVEKMP